MSLTRALMLSLVVAGCASSAPEPGSDPQLQPGNPNPTADAPQIATFSCTPTTGLAPLSSTCTLQGSHPGGKPISCSFTALGRTVELGDCTVAQKRDVFLNSPSKVTVQLVVRDEASLTATQTVELEATLRPNTNPSIDTFVATPGEGVIPFSPTLSFTVTDAENDATTCTIDVFGDGTPEVAAFPCSQTGQKVTINNLATINVLLTATDAWGGKSTKTLQVTGKQASAEIKVSKVEWGQSVIAETLQLVEGKPALLRVHVVADRADLKVAVEAEVRNAAGAVLGKVALSGPATVPTAEQPSTLAGQWTGVVNPAWVAPGLEVRIKADSGDAFAEADEANNLRTVKPAVGRGNIFSLTQVPVVSGGLTGQPFDAQPIMQRMWPVKSVDTRLRAPYTFSGSVAATSTAGWGALLQSLASTRQADGSNRNYYGFVKVTYGSGIAGIGYVGMEAATGRDDSPGTLAHELGHNMGRNHAPCGGASGADASYPYAGAKIGSWGWDSQGGKLLSPATYYDLMAYCPPEWVSDYNYKAVQTFLEAQPNIISAPAQLNLVLVAGVVKDGKVTLRPLHRLVAAAPELQDGATLIRLKGLDGSEVSARVALRDVGDLDEQHFTAFLPDPGALASAEVLSGAAVVARAAAVFGGEPKFQLTRLDGSTLRLKWEGARTASIAHFSDSGERTTLGLWLEGGELNIRTDGLIGGHYEVGLSDGLNSTRANVAAE